MKTKIINQIKGIAANTVLAVLIAGCTAPEEQPEEKKLIVETLPAIQPPFAELIPAFNEYAVDATKGDTIVITSGTRIIIPPNALIDDSGNVVTGKVKIKYREYHDALDIFLSGIPMEYTENGQKGYFQTAGMFEIIAEQNAKELKIAESKTIKVEFASFQPGDEYNFYFFNKNKKKWEYENNIKPKENPKRALIKKEILKLRPKFKIPFDDSHFVFDYTSLLDVDLSLNYENFSQLWKDYWNKDVKSTGILSKANKYGLSMYRIDSRHYPDVEYKGDNYPASLMIWKFIGKKRFPEWVNIPHKAKSSYYYGHKVDLEKIKENEYRITVHCDSGSFAGRVKYHETSIKVKCVMPLKYLFRFTPEQWKHDYDENMRKIAEEERRLQAEAEVNRAIEISGFGIYNFDKLMKMDNALRIAAAFELDEPVNNQLYKLDLVYCFTGDNKTVIKLPSSVWKYVWLDPDDNNYRLFTILPGNKIAFFPVKKYRDIDFRSLMETEDPSYTFVMETQDKTIMSKTDLEKLLNI